MRAEFASAVGKKLGIARTDLIEKDFLLHEILTKLSHDKFFSSSFLFKGGTCLIKAYIGYKRFSEDIDFTWREQALFNNMSQKKLRKELSALIGKVGSLIEIICKDLDLDFKCEKHNRKYVELVGNNKTCTLKVWYTSVVTKEESFIKIQINFVEKLCFESRRVKLSSLLNKRDNELEMLFPEAKNYASSITIDAYDVKEILAEKIRAIMTRRGIKSRDFLDAYFIYKEFGIAPRTVGECSVEKLKYALELYARYRSNFEAKRKLITSGELFGSEVDMGLLLVRIDEKDFGIFMKLLKSTVDTISDEVHKTYV